MTINGLSLHCDYFRGGTPKSWNLPKFPVVYQFVSSIESRYKRVELYVFNRVQFTFEWGWK